VLNNLADAPARAASTLPTRRTQTRSLPLIPSIATTDRAGSASTPNYVERRRPGQPGRAREHGASPSGNHPTETTPLAGGRVVASSRAFAASTPTGNLLSNNRAHGNRHADLIYDTTGDGNRFVRNDLPQSMPNSLCK
jgi:hypothetical protein